MGAGLEGGVYLPMASVGAVVAGSFLIALGVLSLLYGRRDRLRVTFALFAFAWAAVAALALWMQLAPTAQAASARGHWIPAPVAFAVAALVHHILALTGHDQRPAEKLALLPMTVRQFSWVVTLLAPLLAGLGVATDLVVTGAAHHPLFGYYLVFSWTALFFQAPYGLLVLTGSLPLILQALRDADPGPRRTFLQQSLGGFIAMQLSAAVFIMVLPSLHVPTMPVAFDLFTLVAIYFYVIIARYQYRLVQELNEHLEQTVAERTRGLMLAQARLVQTQKLASLGSLVAGVSHEVNTPLGAVRSMEDTRRRAIEKLQARLAEAPAAGGTAWAEDRVVGRALQALKRGDAVVRDGLDRIDAIVTRLRSFAKLDQAELQPVRLSECFDDALALLQTRFDGIELERDVSEEPEILCQARGINQVLFGILSNALDALRGQGRLHLRIAPEAEGVRLELRDNGVGIAEAQLPRVFDPGYTTKGVGVGVGLGLTIAYQVVTDHGGSIEVTSQPGEGTLVSVWLPAQPPAEPLSRRAAQ